MTTEAAPLVIDLGAAAATLRRRAYAAAIGLIVGGIGAAGILFFVPPRFDGHTMMLIRTSTSTLDPTSLIKDKMGSLSELVPSSIGGLGGGAEEELATELALLQSRAVLGAVVDSLRLEVVPKSPSRVPPASIVDSVRLTSRFKPVKVTLDSGKNSLTGVTVWAAQSSKVKLYDREDAIDELSDRLTVKKTGGTAIAISYRGGDSVTAALVPNLIAEVYMLRRKTVDRGLNQRRLEFLTAKADSVRIDLRRSADVLASVAERSGAGASPEIAGKGLADELGVIEAKQSEIRGAEVALDSLILGVRHGRSDPRLLIGFPDLARSPALNELVGQIAKIETDRTILLASRPDASPQSLALGRARDSLAAQILPIANAFGQSLTRTRVSVDRDIARLRAEIGRLPAQAAAVAKEEAEVTRLAAMNAGMGAQVLSARLGALAEGGDVRVIDAAVSPRRVTFPRPIPTIVVCLIAGALGGIVVALLGVPIVTTGQPD